MAVNKMDWQKNLLIAAMVAVLFMLAIRWNDFQENLPSTPTPVAATPGINTDFSTPAADASDIPNVPDTEQATASETAAPTSTATIRVVTDSLDLLIDPRGGDIVRVALPRHYAELNKPDVPFVLLDNDPSHTYIVQSGLVGANGTDTAQGRPLFSAEQTEYRLKEGADQLVVDLTYQQENVKITKRFTFTRGEYLLDMEYLIDNQAETPWVANLYGQIKRDSQDFHKGNALSMKPFLGAAITTPETNYKKLTFEDLAEESFKTETQGGWVAMVQHYFISAWIP